MTNTATKLENNYKTSLKTKGRGRVYDNLAQAVGDTPLVKINKLATQENCVADIYAKLEFFNPLSSIKDRLAYGMIELAEQQGLITKDTILVEPTSGNTGIALAFMAAAKGYKLTLTMPESMSIERRKILKSLGANLELTPAAKGMRGAIDKAQEIVDGDKNAIMLQQFENPANPVMHYATTAEEIWNDTQGDVDIFISGVGTGGTITGVAEFLKSKKDVKIIAVEPEDSPILSGGKPGPHKIQGIGAGFKPDVLNTDVIDEIITISNETAFATARKIALTDGIPAGISSGATIAAAIEVAQKPENKGKKIVVIIASCSERYLSTALFEG